MAIDPISPGPRANYTGSYYALPLRGRLTPHEGGVFKAAPGAIAEEATKAPEKAGPKPGFSFAGFLDIINPLQHIPVVSSIYRRITGDEITPVGRIAGDSLFFGVVGLASALVNAVIEKTTGKDAGDHVMTAMLGEKDKAPHAPVTPVAAPEGAPDDGANNALAAIPQPGPQRGRVTVHPRGGIAPASLDPATLDALARTIGGPGPLAHLAPQPGDSAGADKTGAPAPTAGSAEGPASAASYGDALLRMQQGMERYNALHPH